MVDLYMVIVVKVVCSYVKLDVLMVMFLIVYFVKFIDVVCKVIGEEVFLLVWGDVFVGYIEIVVYFVSDRVCVEEFILEYVCFVCGLY